MKRISSVKEDQVNELRERGLCHDDICRIADVSLSTIYRYTKVTPKEHPLPVFNKEYIPNLRQPFTRCPICGGTTDVDTSGFQFCYSCDTRWDLQGYPLINIS